MPRCSCCYDAIRPIRCTNRSSGSSRSSVSAVVARENARSRRLCMGRSRSARGRRARGRRLCGRVWLAPVAVVSQPGLDEVSTSSSNQAPVLHRIPASSSRSPTPRYRAADVGSSTRSAGSSDGDPARTAHRRRRCDRGGKCQRCVRVRQRALVRVDPRVLAAVELDCRRRLQQRLAPPEGLEPAAPAPHPRTPSQATRDPGTESTPALLRPRASVLQAHRGSPPLTRAAARWSGGAPAGCAQPRFRRRQPRVPPGARRPTMTPIRSVGASLPKRPARRADERTRLSRDGSRYAQPSWRSPSQRARRAPGGSHRIKVQRTGP